MALATRCPSCSTVFRISTAQAAVKGGMVRCGACRNVFNSLDALVRVEDLDVVEEVTIEPVAARPLVGDALPPGSQIVAQDVTDVPANDGDGPEIEAHDGRVEPSIGNDEPPVIAEWWLPDEPPRRSASTPVPRAEPEPTVAGPTTGRTVGATTGAGAASMTGWTASALAAGPATGAHPTSSRPTPVVDEPDDDPAPIESTNPVFMRPDPTYEPAPRGMRLLLGLLSLVAALALLGQLAYLWRDELAARWPPARPWLSSACRTLGCVVGYPVHAESITIESAAVQTLAPSGNTYVLTALLRNRDAIDLRYPTLELVLTDLQDQPILRRDLRPEDYLAGLAGHSPATGFPAQSELPIRITFELTELRFAGYRLNQLYP